MSFAEIITCKTLLAATKIMNHTDFDLIFCDYTIRDSTLNYHSGEDFALWQLKEQGRSIHLLTGIADICAFDPKLEAYNKVDFLKVVKKKLELFPSV